MIFGRHVEPAPSATPAEWIEERCGGVWGTVGALVPNQYPLILRASAPNPNSKDWWSAYRDLLGIVAEIGERHTSTPERAWLAVWDGDGFAETSALSEIPRFALPNRDYYLLEGSVAAATQLREPGSLSNWRRPDLFWPDDRRWFVAADVDFWSLYIGGSSGFISELAERVPTPSEIVPLSHWLEPEI